MVKEVTCEGKGSLILEALSEACELESEGSPVVPARPLRPGTSEEALRAFLKAAPPPAPQPTAPTTPTPSPPPAASSRAASAQTELPFILRTQSDMISALKAKPVRPESPPTPNVADSSAPNTAEGAGQGPFPRRLSGGIKAKWSPSTTPEGAQKLVDAWEKSISAPYRRLVTVYLRGTGRLMGGGPEDIRGLVNGHWAAGRVTVCGLNKRTPREITMTLCHEIKGHGVMNYLIDLAVAGDRRALRLISEYDATIRTEGYSTPRVLDTVSRLLIKEVKGKLSTKDRNRMDVSEDYAQLQGILNDPDLQHLPPEARINKPEKVRIAREIAEYFESIPPWLPDPRYHAKIRRMMRGMKDTEEQRSRQRERVKRPEGVTTRTLKRPRGAGEKRP